GTFEQIVLCVLQRSSVPSLSSLRQSDYAKTKSYSTSDAENNKLNARTINFKKMNKTKKIIYWVATIWLSLGMFSTGIVQLLKMKEDVAKMEHLHYPLYLLTILGVWKILGVIVILLPKLPVVKEWAYAGFFFAMSGAMISHIVSG